MNCPYCRRPLTESDYGEVLVGCIECNRWGRPGDKTLVMELKAADLEALRKARASVKQCQKHRSAPTHGRCVHELYRHALFGCGASRVPGLRRSALLLLAALVKPNPPTRLEGKRFRRWE
jgi:hypothetical protein